MTRTLSSQQLAVPPHNLEAEKSVLGNRPPIQRVREVTGLNS